MDRKQMIDDLESKLREWDARLDAKADELKAKGDEQRAVFEQKRAALRERRAKLESKLASARKSATDGWERTSGELSDAWDELRKAVDGVVDSVRS